MDECSQQKILIQVRTLDRVKLSIISMLFRQGQMKMSQYQKFMA